MDPEEIQGLSGEDLAAQIAEFRANLAEALANENPTTEDVAAARALNETLSALEAEQERRESDAAEFAALREQNAARQQASVQPEEPEVEEDEEDDEEDEEEAVTASARRRLAGRRSAPPMQEPVEEPEDAPRITLTASADVPGIATGAEFADFGAVAQAAFARMQAFPKPSGTKGAPMQRFGVANIIKPFDADRIANGGDSDIVAIETSARESRLQGGSLVAAGGWCAPSETIYDLCAVETTEGIIDIPEFQVRRGGVRYTDGVDFSTIYGSHFKQTEAQAIAGTTKTCYEPDCPEFDEVRLDAFGICIKVPLLTQAGYPELITNTTERALVAYQHAQSADLIGRMVTEAGTAKTVPVQGSTATDTLSALELSADYTRQNYRLALKHTLEVVLPFWVRSAIRADLAARNGVDLLSVSDAQIDSHLSARGLRVQWVYNWQALTEEVTNQFAYPTTYQALMYPAGTFTKGVSPVINLDAVYDAASLQGNTYTGLFFEEGILLLRRCYQPTLLTLGVCSAGRTGAADIVECLTEAETP